MGWFTICRWSSVECLFTSFTRTIWIVRFNTEFWEPLIYSGYNPLWVMRQHCVPVFTSLLSARSWLIVPHLTSWARHDLSREAFPEPPGWGGAMYQGSPDAAPTVVSEPCRRGRLPQGRCRSRHPRRGSCYTLVINYPFIRLFPHVDYKPSEGRDYDWLTPISPELFKY